MNRVIAGLVALLFLAVIAGCVSETAAPATGAKPDPDTARAAERDTAIKAGAEGAEVLTTLDYTTVEKDLDRWESLATGDLLADLEANREQSVQAVTTAKSTSVGTVHSAALAEFDPGKGTARLLAAVTIEVTANGQPSTKRQRMSLSLAKTADGWKVSSLSAL